MGKRSYARLCRRQPSEILSLQQGLGKWRELEGCQVCARGQISDLDLAQIEHQVVAG
jgi:hypothetical protein